MIRRETLQTPSPSDGAHGLIVAPAWVVCCRWGHHLSRSRLLRWARARHPRAHDPLARRPGARRDEPAVASAHRGHDFWRLVYAGLALYRGLHGIGESLGRFTWSAFGLACTLAFGNYLTRFLKWEYYLARLGIKGVPKLDSLLTFLSGLVLTVTPGKVGEVSKSVVLEQTHNVAVARTAPIVLAERLTDVLGIVILIVLGSAGLSGGLVWAGLGIFVVVAVLVVISSDTVFEWLIGLAERGPQRARTLVPKIREAWASLRTLTSPGALIVPTLLSIVAWFLEGLALWVILRGFGEPTPVLVACFFLRHCDARGGAHPGARWARGHRRDPRTATAAFRRCEPLHGHLGDPIGALRDFVVRGADRLRRPRLDAPASPLAHARRRGAPPRSAASTKLKSAGGIPLARSPEFYR